MRLTLQDIARRAFVAGHLVAALSLPAAAEGDPAKGVRAYAKACVPCHSLEPGRNMTGPSLAGVVGRKAGSVEAFNRYSPALRASAMTWTTEALESWLANPQGLIPGNVMTALVADANERADIVAYLKATQPAGGNGRTDIPKPFEKTLDLKSVGAAARIVAIQYCGDTYNLKMENGAILQFWERNLRFKTDSGKEGPAAAKPVLVESGQQGDRAYAVFASPQEFSGLVKPGC